MDESLTHFLESATQSVPYHTQVNICHDIALALTFLHANGIIHRDLSSNNVLLISNIRAKVTYFGRARLYGFSQRSSQLSFIPCMCLGTDVYMPPEATKDQPIYTVKLDCFSFGVIIIQILTRQFPKPGERQKSVAVNLPDLPSNVYVPVPEADRLQNHIRLVSQDHSLLPIALSCLRDKDMERPFAQQLCERISLLKDSTKFSESVIAATVDAQMQWLREEHARVMQSLQEQYSGQMQNQ